jgi:hypothetical protein
MKIQNLIIFLKKSKHLQFLITFQSQVTRLSRISSPLHTEGKTNLTKIKALQGILLFATQPLIFWECV